MSLGQALSVVLTILAVAGLSAMRPSLRWAGADDCAASRAEPGSGCRDAAWPGPLLSGEGGDRPALDEGRPIMPPPAWRTIYHEVERCAGKEGDFDAVRWSVVAAPLQGSTSLIYGYTRGHRIVLVNDDTTYLRHEMLHHILMVAGWRPRRLPPGEHYTIADLHPLPLFGLCTAGR